jgi:protein-S-isoprenylcysteine O-methyltransferase Ste14
MSSKHTLPETSSKLFPSLLTCVLFILFFIGFYNPNLDAQGASLYIIIFLPLIPIFMHCLSRNQQVFPEHALPFKKIRPTNFRRILIKTIGLIASYGFIAFLYWLFPVYHEDLFNPFWTEVQRVLPWVALFAIPYLIYVDNRMKEPEDGYYNLGLLCLGQARRVDKRWIGEHLKCWIVKGFFLSLMTIYLLEDLRLLAHFDLSVINTSKGLYEFLYLLIFTFDVLFAVYGYMFTMKLFNSQIYSTDPTCLGWVVCVMDYYPLWGSVFYGKYFNYEDNFYWGDLFWNYPKLYFIWGGLIIFCLAIYSLSSIAFGLRFSNLTYRGIITSGPYRYTKHPAYVFKNISWWLISIPFIPSTSWTHTIQMCILLLGVNTIYFLRARTEENHLSNYPEYVLYAEYMNKHGIFRWVGKLFPFVRYSKERAARSGSKVYRPFL